MGTPSRDIPTVCVVDDDEAVRDSLYLLLEMRGFAVRTFDSAKAFLAEDQCIDCGCLLVDMHMPEMTGLALLDRLRTSGDLPPAIMISGAGDKNLAEQAQRAGALGLLKKPVSEDELFDYLDRALGDAGRNSSAPV